MKIEFLGPSFILTTTSITATNISTIVVNSNKCRNNNNKTLLLSVNLDLN